MRFSWDAPKSSRNLRERGVDFEFATQIFDARTLERVDSRRDYGERRMIALGKGQDIALTVVYADRAEVGGEIDRRIISARKSSRREREAYKKATTAKYNGPARPRRSRSTSAYVRTGDPGHVASRTRRSSGRFLGRGDCDRARTKAANFSSRRC